MNKFIYIFIFLCSLQSFGQANSVELRDGGGTLVGSFNSIQNAYNAIPADITQPYLIEILQAYNFSDEVYPVTFSARNGSSEINTITIRPAVGNNSAVIQGSYATTSGAILNFSSCKFVILDGRPGGVGDTASLQVRNTSTSGSSYTVQFINNATDNIVRYVHTVNGSANTSGGRNFSFSTSAAGPEGNSRNLISNCFIEGGRSGFSFNGTAAFPNETNTIEFCTIKDFGYAGIWLVENSGGTTIRNNTIFQETASSSIFVSGIHILISGSERGTFIEKNKIYNIFSTANPNTTTTTIRGITATLANLATLSIINNFISITHSGRGTFFGIQLAGSNNFDANIIYNSIYIGGVHNSGTSGSVVSGGIWKNSTTDTGLYVQKNNIVVNNRTGGTTGVFHLGSYISTQALVTDLDIDYNTYYSFGDPGSYHAGWGNVAFDTLTTYQAATGTNEQNSNFHRAYFVSTTDLHLAGSSVGDFELAGTPISEITTDIDGQIRHSTFPYRGADEGDVPLPVELASFTASVSGNSVSLSWTTISEKNNFGFDVERAAIEDQWEKAGFIGGKGTTTEINHYTFSDENLAAGKYSYRLKQIDFNGTFEYSNAIEVEVNLTPSQYSLEQNYPNPFNPSTTIKYSIPNTEFVSIKIYDVIGNELTTLINREQSAGNYEVSFDASSLSSGIYLYKIISGSFIQTKKMLLLK